MKNKEYLYTKDPSGKTPLDIIDEKFYEIILIAEVFPSMFLEKEENKTRTSEKSFKDYSNKQLGLIYDKFSLIQITLKEINDNISIEGTESPESLTIEFKKTIDMTKEERDEFFAWDVSKSTKQMYIWLRLYIDNLKILQENSLTYLKDSVILKDDLDYLFNNISSMFKQIHSIKDVLNNEAFTSGSIQRKIKIQ
jgi:hypothetical protein